MPNPVKRIARWRVTHRGMAAARVGEVSTALSAAVESLRPLPVGYQALFARLLTVTEPDQRVRGLWLSGSVGRGTADAGSDLDVVVTVADASFQDFCAGWRDWLASITATIIARDIPGVPGAFYSVTPGCERFDVVVERVSDIASAHGASRLAVIDRDSLAAHLSSVAAEQAGPSPAVLSSILEEFFRHQVIFPAAVVAREDWLLGVVAVGNVQRMLYEILVEANQPLPAMGVKQWSSRLTAGQRAHLESLPVPNPRRVEVLEAMLAVRLAMLTLGRETVTRCGVAWPEELAAATTAYHERELGTSAASSSPEAAASAFRTSPMTRIATPGE